MTTSYLKLMGAQRKVVYLRATFCLMVDAWKWTNSKCSLKFCLEFFLFVNEFVHSWLDFWGFFLVYTSSHSVFRKFCRIQQNHLEAVSFCWFGFFYLWRAVTGISRNLLIGCCEGCDTRKWRTHWLFFLLIFPCNTYTYSVFLVKLGMISQQSLFFITLIFKMWVYKIYKQWKLTF